MINPLSKLGMAISSLDRLAAKPGDEVFVSGRNLSSGIKVAVNGQNIDLKISDSSNASFKLPENVASGILEVTFKSRGSTLAKLPLMNMDDVESLTPTSIPASRICDDTIFKDENGQLVKGKVKCEQVQALADCTEDGQTGCVATDSFPAVDTSGLASKVLSTDTVAGITGSALPRPADCSVDGDTDCVVDGTSAKATILSGFSSADIRAGVTIAGVTGVMSGSPAACITDGETGCLANNNYPAALFAGAAAKILTGQTLAGANGSAAPRPGDCSADGDTGCVAVANFPAVNKVTNLSAASLAKIHSTVTVGGVAGTMASCSTDGGTDCMAIANFPAVNKVTNLSVASLAKIHSTVTVGGVAGTMASCSTDGGTDCMAITNFPAVDKVTNLSAANLDKMHTTVTVGGVAGTMPSCSGDGETDCMAITNFPAVNKLTNLSAANLDKMHTTVTVGGVAGTMPSCSGDGETDCMAITNFPAVDKVTSLSAVNLDKMHTSVSVGGVAGTMPSCSGDGETDCMAITNFPAVNKLTNLSAANLDKMHTTVTVGGVAGTMPSCSGDGETDCMAITNFPAVVKANVTEGVIKGGTVIAGVSGLYPNATYPLAGADSGTADLDSATFNAKIKTSTAFEWFSSAGTRYTGSGDTDLDAANIKSGTDVFGSTGTFGAACTADGTTNCLTTNRYKSMDTDSTVISGWDIRSGKTAGGIVGKLVFYKSMAQLTTFNRTAGDGSSASTTVADFYDTIDDNNNNLAFPTDALPGETAPGLNWLRDPVSDTGLPTGTALDGTCDGTEACVYKDQTTGLYWAKDDATSRSWEASVTYCDASSYGGYSDWRMPTQKELLQVYTDGIWSVRTPLGIGYSTYWSSTVSGSLTSAAHILFSQGYASNTAKVGPSYRVVCVR